MKFLPNAYLLSESKTNDYSSRDSVGRKRSTDEAMKQNETISDTTNHSEMNSGDDDERNNATTITSKETTINADRNEDVKYMDNTTIDRTTTLNEKTVLHQSTDVLRRKHPVTTVTIATTTTTTTTVSASPMIPSKVDESESHLLTSPSHRISRIGDSDTDHAYQPFSAPVDITHTKSGQDILRHQQILRRQAEKSHYGGLSYGGVVSLSILGVTFGLLLLLWFCKRCVLRKRRSKKDSKKMSIAGGKLAADLKTAAHLSEALKSQDSVPLKSDMEMNESAQAGETDKEKQYCGN
ncbi:unnamed protein product [Heterobilharzia americana]|nr:unnamed protein product [Heterobilharzia americana]